MSGQGLRDAPLLPRSRADSGSGPSNLVLSRPVAACVCLALVVAAFTAGTLVELCSYNPHQQQQQQQQRLTLLAGGGAAALEGRDGAGAATDAQLAAIQADVAQLKEQGRTSSASLASLASLQSDVVQIKDLLNGLEKKARGMAGGGRRRRGDPSDADDGSAGQAPGSLDNEFTSAARQQQRQFCETKHPLKTPGVNPVTLSKLPGAPVIHVYASKNATNDFDIVSDWIAKEGMWEEKDVKELLWAMEQPIPSAVAASDPKLFVDVGANIGWFTLNLASRGYRVAAIEGMTANQQLIRSSLCASPSLADRVTLYAYGLGMRPQTCYIYSGINNKGDGMTNCDAKSETEASKMVPEGYELRGAMHLQRLDNLLPGQDIKAIKMDVEGYEYFVIRGADGLFQKHNVWYMATEFSYAMAESAMKRTHPKEYVRLILDLGFRVSSQGFAGPFFKSPYTEEELEAWSKEVGKAGQNLYCVNNKLPL